MKERLWRSLLLEGVHYYLISTYRVPTKIALSNSLCFPCVFPIQLQIFPVPIYVICDYYIHKTDLADLSNFTEFSHQISEYLLPLGSGNLQLEQTKFPVFWQIFQIPCVFPDRESFWPCSLFSLCSGDPAPNKMLNLLNC